MQLRKVSSSMNRTSIDSTNSIIKSGEYVVDGLMLSNQKVTIEIEVNSTCDILLNNIKDILELNIVINQDSRVNLSFLSEEEMKESNININVKRNAALIGYFADLSVNTLNLHCKVNLLEEGAECTYKVATLVADNDRKFIDVSIDHLSPRTYGKFDCFGICKDNGKVTVAGTSHVFKGSVKSNAQQNCKIMVFDENSDATAKPVLKIDENDLMASHGAVVGKINDEHLFYLTSRGLSEEAAKELITWGYLRPILAGFIEEDMKNHISSLIERRM